MRLTHEIAQKLRIGDVVRFSWNDSENRSLTDSGVVTCIDSKGIRCNCEAERTFIVKPHQFDGSIKVSLVPETEHAPVVEFENGFDFAAKRIQAVFTNLIKGKLLLKSEGFSFCTREIAFFPCNAQIKTLFFRAILHRKKAK